MESGIYPLTTQVTPTIIPGLPNEITLEIMRDIEVFAGILFASPVFARAYGIGSGRDEANVMRWQKWCGIEVMVMMVNGTNYRMTTPWVNHAAALIMIIDDPDMEMVSYQRGAHNQLFTSRSTIQDVESYLVGVRVGDNTYVINCSADGKLLKLSVYVQTTTLLWNICVDVDSYLGELSVGTVGYIPFVQDGVDKIAVVGAVFRDNGAWREASINVVTNETGKDPDYIIRITGEEDLDMLLPAARELYESSWITFEVFRKITESARISYADVCKLVDDHVYDACGAPNTAAAILHELVMEGFDVGAEDVPSQVSEHVCSDDVGECIRNMMRSETQNTPGRAQSKCALWIPRWMRR